MLAAAAVFTLLCIMQVNNYARDTYLIQDYQRKIAGLTAENKALGVNYSGANSLDNVAAYAQSQIFEKAEKISYIKISGATAVAK